MIEFLVNMNCIHYISKQYSLGEICYFWSSILNVKMRDKFPRDSMIITTIVTLKVELVFVYCCEQNDCSLFNFYARENYDIDSSQQI